MNCLFILGIGKAFSILSDAEKRRQYDISGDEDALASSHTYSSTTRRRRHAPEAEIDPQELFNIFFGQVYGQRSGKVFVFKKRAKSEEHRAKSEKQNKRRRFKQYIYFYIYIYMYILKRLIFVYEHFVYLYIHLYIGFYNVRHRHYQQDSDDDDSSDSQRRRARHHFTSSSSSSSSSGGGGSKSTAVPEDDLAAFYRLVVTFIPFLLILLLFLLSNFNVEDRRPFSFELDKTFTEKRTTDKNVDFYITKPVAAQLQSNEAYTAKYVAEVHRQYLGLIQQQCQQEKLLKKRKIDRATYYGDPVQIRAATDIPLPACERLTAFLSAAA